MSEKEYKDEIEFFFNFPTRKDSKVKIHDKRKVSDSRKKCYQPGKTVVSSATE